MSRFPVAFRPPAFASWSSFARRGTGPPSRSAYRPLSPGTGPQRDCHVSHARDTAGLGALLTPGTAVPCTTGNGPPVAARRHSTAKSLDPGTAPTIRGWTLRGVNEGSSLFTRPAFPFTCGPRVERDALGLAPRASDPAVTGDARRGGDRHVGHLPGLRHHQQALRST